MFKKTSNYLIASSVLLVFSLLLVSCQSLIGSTEEMDRERAMDAWGANLSAQGQAYFEELENRERAIDAWGANLTAQGQAYFEEMKRFRAIDAWGANLTAQGERYLEELAQSPAMELSSDESSEAVMALNNSMSGIEIQHTKVQARTILTVYTVMSDGPGWVVLHADQDGTAGAVLEHIWVPSGTTRIARTEVQEIGSEPIHVMLHQDHGWVGYFEFPRTDGPVLVDNVMINELCLCSY
jgi:hypothetical protein